MAKTPSEQKAADREAIARATAEFLSDGGEIQKLGNRLGPTKNLTWRGESNAIWKAKIRGDLPVKAPPRPKPVKTKRKATPRAAIERMSEARSAKHKAARDALEPTVRKLAGLGVIRAHIAQTVGVSATTIDKIGREHGIDIPLQPRRGTRQARNNAELREEWE